MTLYVVPGVVEEGGLPSGFHESTRRDSGWVAWVVPGVAWVNRGELTYALLSPPQVLSLELPLQPIDSVRLCLDSAGNRDADSG